MARVPGNRKPRQARGVVGLLWGGASGVGAVIPAVRASARRQPDALIMPHPIVGPSVSWVDDD